MPITTLHLRTRRPIDYGTTPGSTTITRRGRELLRRFVNVAMGAVGASQSDTDYVLAYSASDPATANASLAISGASGAVGATINGVTVTATHAVSDANDAALIAAAINASANALVQGFVQANNLTATVTCASVAAGDEVYLCGYRLTAVSGTPGQPTVGANLFTFDISGSDTADAAALCAAINAAPGLSRFVYATCGSTTAGAVRLYARQFVFSGTVTFTWPTGPGFPPNIVASSNGTRLACSAAALAQGAFVGLCATQPGVFGNAVTLAASGTGVSVQNSETRLARGLGPNSSTLTVLDDASGVS